MERSKTQIWSSLTKARTGKPVETVIGLCRAAEKLRNAQRLHPVFHDDAAAETRTDVVPIPHTALAAEPGTAAVSASGAIRSAVSKPVSWVRVTLLSASIRIKRSAVRAIGRPAGTVLRLVRPTDGRLPCHSADVFEVHANVAQRCRLEHRGTETR